MQLERKEINTSNNAINTQQHGTQGRGKSAEWQGIAKETPLNKRLCSFEVLLSLLMLSAILTWDCFTFGS